MAVAIAVVGTHKSGKTTTVEYLISRLSKEGYRVGSIKHIHHQDFSIDTEGTDTWRHMHAGAVATVAIAPKEMVIIKKPEVSPSLEKLMKFFDEERVDFVFIEGLHSIIAKNSNIPKIITAKNYEDLIRTLEGTAKPIIAITGAVAEKKTEVDEIKIPMINISTDGDLLFRLVKEKAKQNLTRK